MGNFDVSGRYIYLNCILASNNFFSKVLYCSIPLKRLIIINSGLLQHLRLLESRRKYADNTVLNILKYGFISSPGNGILLMCLLCNRTMTIESMKHSQLKEHLIKIISDKKIEKDLMLFSKQSKINI